MKRQKRAKQQKRAQKKARGYMSLKQRKNKDV